MRELIELLKTKDHFELLETLSARLSRSAEIVKTIGRCMELDEVGTVRQELPEHLVEAYILIEVLKVKLSVMPPEWNKKVDEVVEILKDENKPDFSDAEF